LTTFAGRALAGAAPGPPTEETDMNTDYEKHFAEAKRIYGMSWEDDRTEEESTLLIARAQVHATLALAAATVRPKITAQTHITNGSGVVECRNQDGTVERIDLEFDNPLQECPEYVAYGVLCDQCAKGKS
jgi:hypothetical protein